MWKSLEDQLHSMSKENEIHLNEALVSLRKGNMNLEEYLKKFKAICDKLVPMKKPLDETTIVFHLARGRREKYKNFRIAMLSKAPYPTYNQFVQSLRNHELQLASDIEEEKLQHHTDMNQAFYSQRRRFIGRGRSYHQRGRANHQVSNTQAQPDASNQSSHKHPQGTAQQLKVSPILKESGV